MKSFHIKKKRLDTISANAQQLPLSENWGRKLGVNKVRLALRKLEHQSFSKEWKVRFWRVDLIFHKVKLDFKTRKIQKFIKKEDQESEQAGNFITTPVPSPEVASFQVVIEKGVKEGLYLKTTIQARQGIIVWLSFSFF